VGVCDSPVLLCDPPVIVGHPTVVLRDLSVIWGDPQGGIAHECCMRACERWGALVGIGGLHVYGRATRDVTVRADGGTGGACPPGQDRHFVDVNKIVYSRVPTEQ
jgi:hypothetical protein